MKTLVFGASTNPERYSYLAVEMLTTHHIPTVAFGTKSGTIFGVEIDTDIVQYTDIDTITLYLNPKRQRDFYDYFISLKPRRVIFNPGTENPKLMQLLTDNNIHFEVACTLVLLSTGQF